LKVHTQACQAKCNEKHDFVSDPRIVRTFPVFGVLVDSGECCYPLIRADFSHTQILLTLPITLPDPPGYYQNQHPGNHENNGAEEQGPLV
jgi:hypothetical protein